MSKKKKKKLYVVGRGRRPGIYATWDECKAQVDGYAGAQYKSFTQVYEAQQAYADWMKQHPDEIDWSTVLPAGFTAGSGATAQTLIDVPPPVVPSFAVDAAASGNPGPVEYRGVDTESGRVIFAEGPYPDGTTNIGEFLAIVDMLRYCHAKGIDRPIYSDSRTGLAWVRNKRVNTTLARSRRNERLFVKLEAAVAWLKENRFKNKLLKWDTENWGEIPADYGRK